MNKEEKEQIETVVEDEAAVEAIEKNIKSSFRVIIGIAAFVLLALVGLAIYAHFADSTYEVSDGIPSEYTYENFPFVKNGQLWQTQLIKPTEAGPQQYDILVYFSPLELVDIPIGDELYKQIYDTNRVILALNDSSLTQDGSSAQAAIGAIELGKIVGTKYNILNKQTSSAVINPRENVASNVNIVDCSIAVPNQTEVVVFSLANQTAVYEGADGCIHVDGVSGTDIIRAADRFMFQIAGIMR